MFGNEATKIPETGSIPGRARICYPIPEVGRLLGDLPERVVRGLIERGDLRSVEIARRRVVPADALQEFAAKRNITLPGWVIAGVGR